MGKVISFNSNNDDDIKSKETKEEEHQEENTLPPFLKELREFILSYYPKTMSDILGFSGFLKNDNPYVFVGYAFWQDVKGNQYITPLIAMFRNVDKRFVFLNAKNHYFDPKVLKQDIESLNINIDKIFEALNSQNPQ